MIEAAPRYPFGIPRGWFVVALSGDLPTLPSGEASTPQRLRAFSRDLVLYRGASGQPYLVDAYCPHLGAHLGHGGCVEGESIRCPYHGWRFDTEGRCVEVPLSPITPEKARLRTYPVCEQNGVIHAFFDPAGGAPWPLPVLDEEAWTEGRVVHWRNLKTHAQEVFENTVDTAHIGPVHAGIGARLRKKPVRDGERLEIDIEFEAPGDIVGMPGTLNDVQLLVRMLGLGVVVVQTHVRNVDVRARQRIYCTPIEDDTVDIRGIVHVERGPDAAFTDELARIFYDAYVEDFAKDFPIWENKRYLTTPLLSTADGPIGLYRRWCEQFYDAARPSSEARSTAEVRPDVTKGALLRRVVEERVMAPARAGMAALRGSFGAARSTPREPQPPAEREHERAAATPVAPSTARPRRVASAEEYFETLPARFVPEASRGVDAVFQWELGDSTFHAEVHDGKLEVREGPHEKPTVALVMPAEAYVRVVNGDLDGTWAFTTGVGKVKGSLTAAMKMRSLFPQ